MYGRFNFLTFAAAMVLALTTAQQLQHSTPHCQGGDLKYQCRGLQFTLQKESDDDFMRVNWRTGAVDHVGDQPKSDDDHMKHLTFFSPCDFEGEYASLGSGKWFQLCVCRQDTRNKYDNGCNKKRLVRQWKGDEGYVLLS